MPNTEEESLGRVGQRALKHASSQLGNMHIFGHNVEHAEGRGGVHRVMGILYSDETHSDGRVLYKRRGTRTICYRI